jgi:hypothetical protein
MIDEMDRLRECVALRTLIEHYAQLAAPDRQVWQDRRAEQEGCDARAMTLLHGELIACGWLEQNTGATPGIRRHDAPGCYRITTSGVRVLKQVREEERAAA